MSIQIEYVGIDSIKPYRNNARKHQTEDLQAIVESIKEFGFKDPIGVWNNEIVEGHGRLMAAKDLGMKEVPIIRLDDLTDEQRRAYALAHNKTAELSSWYEEILDAELMDIAEIDMSLFGFDVDMFDEPKPEENEPDIDFSDIEKLEKHYGVPYQGNKSRIADIIVSILPIGQRLVDLFGGGGAITHCAMLSDKWESFLYNDLNEMITGLFMDAVHGKYHDEHRVITREDFENLKETDAYVKYIWSFGNNGLAYLWGKEIEAIKCAACHALTDETLKDRRLAYMNYVKLVKEAVSDISNRLEPLERISELHALESLERLHALESLEITNISYTDYEYQEGDVVYCDVPYEQKGKKKCDDYGMQFDSVEFYEWVKSRPYQVFFSSYEISDDSFYKIKIKAVASLIGATTNGQKRNEYLYSNMPIEYKNDAKAMEKQN